MSSNDYRAIPALRDDQIQKFWDRVSMSEPDSCWEWKACIGRLGYGNVRYGSNRNGRKGKAYLSHRVAYFLHYGVDPLLKCVLHTCDNPPCCNPHHLRLGTKKENTADMKAKGRDKLFKNGRVSVFIGEKAARARPYISNNDIYLMREMYFSGLFSQKFICRTFKLASQTVSRIMKGTSWKHIPMPPVTHYHGRKYYLCKYR